MTCEQVQAELVECWGSTEEVCAATIEHLEVCAECRREALILRETRVMVQSLPREKAPQGLTSTVLERITREEQAQPGWMERLSDLLAPRRRPSWARAAAVGAAIALAVAGGAVWMSQDAEQPAAPQIAAHRAATTTVSVTTDNMPTATSEEELDELLMRHQTMEMTQPLADDAGVSLVVYTSN